MIDASDVTACLVTRGDQPGQMQRILDSLIFGRVIVWDNSRRPSDCKTAGRYMAAREAETGIVYFQDDDVLVPPITQRALLEAYRPRVMVANWGHGDNADCYDDLPLVGAGAIVERALPEDAIARYLAHWPLDEGFLYDCDFAVGVLYPEFEHHHLPFEINLGIAQHHSRLCNQPWQPDLKREITNRARAIRDRAKVAA